MPPDVSATVPTTFPAVVVCAVAAGVNARAPHIASAKGKAVRNRLIPNVPFPARKPFPNTSNDTGRNPNMQDSISYSSLEWSFLDALLAPSQLPYVVTSFNQFTPNRGVCNLSL
jgi:hypothetical protein